jgi:hypothetical protein
MQQDQPFMFAKDKMLHTKPICWSNEPENLSRRLEMPVETIEETQKTLLNQSLLNSTPVRPKFLQEYELELTRTAAHIRNLEKIPIYTDEMKDGL